MGSSAPDPCEQLREQAAGWFSRMRRPDADDFRDEFEAWLAAEPEHLAVYNRISGRFSDAKVLRADAGFQPHKPATSGASWWRKPALVSSVAAILILIAGWLVVSTDSFHSGPSPLIAERTNGVANPSQLATARGEIRTVRLADGSRVTLDTDSLLTVAFSSARRQLRLERGRARFDVAHESRPFVIAAGDGTVTARGTLFDVAIDPRNSVRVVLLRGAVDVANLTRSEAVSPAPAIRKLTPGNAVEYGPAGSAIEPIAFAKAQPSWPEGLVDFDQAPLSDIIEQANRYSSLHISLGDPALATLKISGRFRINDAERLAENAAQVFNLSVDRSTPGEIVLSPR